MSWCVFSSSIRATMGEKICAGKESKNASKEPNLRIDLCAATAWKSEVKFEQYIFQSKYK